MVLICETLFDATLCSTLPSNGCLTVGTTAGDEHSWPMSSGGKRLLAGPKRVSGRISKWSELVGDALLVKADVIESGVKIRKDVSVPDGVAMAKL